ncbi:MAG: hypothetical protein J3K34DRAFT_406205, partial [Monoraphidium minutum]
MGRRGPLGRSLALLLLLGAMCSGAHAQKWMHQLLGGRLSEARTALAKSLNDTRGGIQACQDADAQLSLFRSNLSSVAGEVWKRQAELAAARMKLDFSRLDLLSSQRAAADADAAKQKVQLRLSGATATRAQAATMLDAAASEID